MATDSPTDRDESNVLRRFYSEIEAVLDPAAVARKLWQGGVLTEGQLDEAELASHFTGSEEVRSHERSEEGCLEVILERYGSLLRLSSSFQHLVPIARRMKKRIEQR